MKKVLTNPYILITFAVLLFYGGLLSGDMLYTGDIFTYQLPEKFMIRESLLNGSLPFMNPYILSGSPMLNNIAVAAFYPLNLLLTAGSPLFGFNLFIFVHIILAGFAMYLLLRKGLRIDSRIALLGGISYTLSGPLQGAIDKGFLVSLWIIPLFFLGVMQYFREDPESESDKSKKRITFLNNPLLLPVAALTLLFYCGNFFEAYIAVITAGTGVLLFSIITRKRIETGGENSIPFSDILKHISRKILCYSLIVSIAAMLAAPQIIPTYIASTHSYRSSGLTLKEAQNWSLPAKRVVEFAVPLIFGTRTESGFFFEKTDYSPLSTNKTEGSSPWFDSLFFGYPLLIGLFFAIFAIFRKRESRTSEENSQKQISIFILSGAVIFFLTALGKHTPLYAIFYYILPGFNVFRHPEKFMEWVNVFLIVLGAYGLHISIIQNRKRDIRYIRNIIYRTGVFLISGTGIVLFLQSYRNEMIPQLISHWLLIILASSLLIIALLALALFIFRKQPEKLIYTFIIITIIHFSYVSIFSQSTIPVEKFESTRVWSDFLPDFDKRQYRIFTSDKFRLNKPSESYTFQDLKLDEYRNLNFNAPALKKIRTPQGFDAVMDQSYMDYFNFKKHSPNQLMNLLSVKYIASPLPLTAEVPEGFKKVKITGGIQPASMILENPAALPRISAYSKSGKSNPNLKIVDDKPGKIVLEISNAPAEIVIRDWFSPGWSCRDENGKNIPIKATDGGVMAISVNAKFAKLTLSFIPPGLFTGLAIAVLGIMLMFTAKFAKQN